MGNLFGPSPQQKKSEMYQTLFSLPPEQRSFQRALSEAIKLGSSDPVARAQEFIKIDKADRDRLKDILPAPAGTEQATPLILDLLKQANLPTTGLSEPAPLPAPLGRRAGTGAPLSLPELVSMVPQIGDAIAQGRVPGPVVGSQPELTLFGAPARDALPQQPIPGAFVPSSVVSEASKLVGSRQKDPYANLSEVELSVKAAQGDPLAAKVLQDIQTRRVEVSVKQGLGKEEAKRTLPLSPEERQNLIHPQTLAIAPAGLSEQQAIDQGYIKANPQQLQKLADIEQTQTLVDFLSGLAKMTITAEDPISALTQGAKLTAGALAKTNPPAAAYQDSRQAFLGVISRNLAGERGVLTDRDIGRIDAMLPGFRDTAQIRDFKLQMLQTLLSTARREQQRVILGKPIAEARKATQDQIGRVFDLLNQNAPAADKKQKQRDKYGVP